MPGQLFTQYFLSEGIRTTSEWEDSSPATAELREQLSQIWHTFSKYHQPNEAVTEEQSYAPIRAVQRRLTGESAQGCMLMVRRVVRTKTEQTLVPIARTVAWSGSLTWTLYIRAA